MYQNTRESWWPLSPTYKGLYRNAYGMYGFEDLVAWLQHSRRSKGTFYSIGRNGLVPDYLTTAIYHLFPPCGYIRAHHLRHLASSYKRHIQGPFGYMGWRVARGRTWEGFCRCYNGGHWPEVTHQTLLGGVACLTLTQDCCCPPLPWSPLLSWRPQVQAVDWGRLQGSNEGKGALQSIGIANLIHCIRYICRQYQSMCLNKWWNA